MIKIFLSYCKTNEISNIKFSTSNKSLMKKLIKNLIVNLINLNHLFISKV